MITSFRWSFGCRFLLEFPVSSVVFTVSHGFHVYCGFCGFRGSCLYSSFNSSCGYWGFPASHVAPQVLPWLVVVFQWFSLVPWFPWFPWLVCVFCFLLFLLFLWFLMFLLFPLLVWLQSDVASQQLINLTVKMTIARFVETSVTVNNNPFQDHTHLDDHFPPTLDTDIYFHLFQYSGSFKVTLSCSKSISWQIFLMYKNLHRF